MRLDIQKLDERIRKLQEIRKMLEDPETCALLMELIETGVLPNLEQQSPSATTEAGTELTDILRKLDSPQEQEPSSGLWGIRRK